MREPIRDRGRLEHMLEHIDKALHNPAVGFRGRQILDIKWEDKLEN